MPKYLSKIIIFIIITFAAGILVGITIDKLMNSKTKLPLNSNNNLPNNNPISPLQEKTAKGNLTFITGQYNDNQEFKKIDGVDLVLLNQKGEIINKLKTIGGEANINIEVSLDKNSA